MRCEVDPTSYAGVKCTRTSVGLVLVRLLPAQVNCVMPNGYTETLNLWRAPPSKSQTPKNMVSRAVSCRWSTPVGHAENQQHVCPEPHNIIPLPHSRTFFCHFSPVNSTAPALTTTMTSPQSSFGQKVGLCFPRMIGAIWAASRPTICCFEREGQDIFIRDICT